MFDFATIDEEDFHEISMCDTVIASFRVTWQKVRQYKDGWALLTAKTYLGGSVRLSVLLVTPVYRSSF